MKKSVHFDDTDQIQVFWNDEAQDEARCLDNLDGLVDANWSHVDRDGHSLRLAQKQWQRKLKRVHLQLVQVCTLPKSERPSTHYYKLPHGPPNRYVECADTDAIISSVQRHEREYFVILHTRIKNRKLDALAELLYLAGSEDKEAPVVGGVISGGESDLEQQQPPPPSSSTWLPVLGGPLLGSLYVNGLRQSARFMPVMGTLFSKKGIRQSARLLHNPFGQASGP